MAQVETPHPSYRTFDPYRSGSLDGGCLSHSGREGQILDVAEEGRVTA
jgi:hypothetical protein